MQKVSCYECGKNYDYDEDGFCPRCGAFNQRPRDRKAGLRADGLNEQNHAKSFLHKELHAEDRRRRQLGLERKEQHSVNVRTTVKNRRSGVKTQEKIGKLIGWIVFLLALLSILPELLNFF